MKKGFASSSNLSGIDVAISGKSVANTICKWLFQIFATKVRQTGSSNSIPDCISMFKYVCDLAECKHKHRIFRQSYNYEQIMNNFRRYIEELNLGLSSVMFIGSSLENEYNVMLLKISSRPDKSEFNFTKMDSRTFVDLRH